MRWYAGDRTAVRLKMGHGLTVTEVGLAFVQDARRRGEICRPLDWVPEVHHPLGSGEAVIPDALVYYRTREADRDEGGVMLRAFVEFDRASSHCDRRRVGARPRCAPARFCGSWAVARQSWCPGCSVRARVPVHCGRDRAGLSSCGA
ncbi:replication-relaxation family protein [Streptomyces sp. NPDC002701]|uniref:replication-relaxation family protein n=1 Tax=Streptomyces sp. NPDC002701 TaxID=3364661 RepID=UPI0036AB863C